MSRRTALLSVVWMVFAITPAMSQAPKAAPPPKPAPSTTEEVLNAWAEPSRTILEMAEDFPESKYDFKPTPEVRTFAEQLLHIAGGNQLFLKMAKGEKWTPEEGSPPRSQYPTKAAVVGLVKKSFDDVSAYIKAQGDAGLAKPIQHPFQNRMILQSNFWIEFVQHVSEHYGQLVVYYRLNGLVPPESRPRL